MRVAFITKIDYYMAAYYKIIIQYIYIRNRYHNYNLLRATVTPCFFFSFLKSAGILMSTLFSFVSILPPPNTAETEAEFIIKNFIMAGTERIYYRWDHFITETSTVNRFFLYM